MVPERRRGPGGKFAAQLTAEDRRLRDIGETSWLNEVMELASLYHWLSYHTHDSRRCVPGFPDLVLVRERVVYAELKTETGRIRPEQILWADRLIAAGAEHYIWRPSDLHRVNEILR